MELVIGVFVCMYGMFLGSFYNVVALRVPIGESIVKPRSHCVACNRSLRVRELVPIFSYLFQRGKCRGCGTRISPLYCVFEGITTLGFLVSYGLYGITPMFFLSITLVSLLVIISLADLTYMIIPNSILLVFFLIIFLEQLLFSPYISIISAIIGSIEGFLLLWMIAILSKGGMGGGDIKLYAVIGLALGWKLTFLSLFFAAFIGLIYGLYERIRGELRKGQEIPFGPFIAIGTILAFWFGEYLIQWYMYLF